MLITQMIDSTFERFRYHKPLPNFYKIENPQNPKREISDDLLNELDGFAKKDGFRGTIINAIDEVMK